MALEKELHFERAPITEAVIDIQVGFDYEVSLDDLAALQSALGDAYPKRQERIEVTGRIESGTAVAASAQRKVIGYTFSSPDEKDIMQARLDGFSLSRLKPYHRWETFSATARSLWDIYVSQLGPSRLRRVALRYLNRIELPLPFEDFGEYLTFVPDIPDGLPDAMSDFFLHLEIPDDPEESQAMILLNGTIIKDEAGDATLLPILLDIDIFQPFDTDVDQEAVWATLDVLRARKNAVFMACTTQKLRELIS